MLEILIVVVIVLIVIDSFLLIVTDSLLLLLLLRRIHISWAILIAIMTAASLLSVMFAIMLITPMLLVLLLAMLVFLFLVATMTAFSTGRRRGARRIGRRGRQNRAVIIIRALGFGISLIRVIVIIVHNERFVTIVVVATVIGISRDLSGRSFIFPVLVFARTNAVGVPSFGISLSVIAIAVSSVARVRVLGIQNVSAPDVGAIDVARPPAAYGAPAARVVRAVLDHALVGVAEGNRVRRVETVGQLLGDEGLLDLLALLRVVILPGGVVFVVEIGELLPLPANWLRRTVAI